MTGIIITGKKTRFRCDLTKVHYVVSGAYDIDGNLRNDFKFQNGQEVEAIENEDGTVTVKWQP